MLSSILTLIGRIFLSGIFIWSGVGKLRDWSGTAGYMKAAGMPSVTLFLVGAVILELGGGLLLLLGLKTRLGALALIVFLVPATLIFHNFWAYEGQEMAGQLINFMKNVGILGGLLFPLAYGGGGASLDGRKQ